MSNAIVDISQRPRFGTGTGLARGQILIDRLKLSPKSTLGITGSNGKGSTAAMAGALLSEAGLRTGLFTSPHFLEPEERFRIDGVPVEACQLEPLAREVLTVVESIESTISQQYSRFEILTAVAWLLFERMQVDAIVMEAGIGGRFCPTRLGTPEIYAITSLDLEHTEILGDSLDLILSDKLDLGGAGSTCFAALPNDPELLEFATHQAQDKGIALATIGQLWPHLRYVASTTPKFEGRDRYGHDVIVNLPLLGPWQANNAALAISCAYAALTKMGRAPAEHNFQSWVENSFASVNVPGRFTQVSITPSVVVDSAHTPDAMTQVVDFIESLPDSERIVLCGMSANKRYEEMSGILAKLQCRFFVSTSRHGGADPKVIAGLLAQQGASVESFDSDLETTLRQAIDFATKRGCPLYVLGGLFFAADVCRLLKGKNPGDAIYL